MNHKIGVLLVLKNPLKNHDRWLAIWSKSLQKPVKEFNFNEAAVLPSGNSTLKMISSEIYLKNFANN